MIEEASKKGKLKESCVDLTLKDLPVYNLANMKDEHGVACAPKGGVACPFPWRLHECLEAVEHEGLDHIVSWAPHGRAFTVHHPEKFVELVLPRFFDQTKYPSFQRQLNIYGFSRFLHGRDKGAYYHIQFVRGHPSLVREMVRQKVKGNKHLPKPKKTQYDFYHPAWKTHVDGSADSAAALLALAEQAADRITPSVKATPATKGESSKAMKDKKLSPKMDTKLAKPDTHASSKQQEEPSSPVVKPSAKSTRARVEQKTAAQSPSQDITVAMHDSQNAASTPVVGSRYPAPLPAFEQLQRDQVAAVAKTAFIPPLPAAAWSNVAQQTNQQQLLLSAARAQDIHSARLGLRNDGGRYMLPSYGQEHYKPAVAPGPTISYSELSAQQRELILQDHYRAALQSQQQQHALMTAALHDRLNAASLQYSELPRHHHLDQHAMVASMAVSGAPSSYPSVLTLPSGSTVSNGAYPAFPQAGVSSIGVANRLTLAQYPHATAMPSSYLQGKAPLASYPLGVASLNDPKNVYTAPAQSSFAPLSRPLYEPVVYVVHVKQ
ncbi:hypothetical protein ACA910_005648 [Epithemia clementina (nom. ined.)]